MICRNSAGAKAGCELLFPTGTWTVSTGAAADSYTLTRHRRIYASGRVHIRRGNRPRLWLRPVRLPPGRYVLTIIVTSAHHQRVLLRETVRVTT